MTERKQAIQWRAVMQGVAIVYGVTFVSGLLLAINGITPQTNHVAFPILALLTGAVGVAIALRVAETTRLSYLVALSLGVWLLNSTSILLGAQTVTAWLDSSLFIGTTDPGPIAAGKRLRDSADFRSVSFPNHLQEQLTGWDTSRGEIDSIDHELLISLSKSDRFTTEPLTPSHTPVQDGVNPADMNGINRFAVREKTQQPAQEGWLSSMRTMSWRL
jgi:hypothetical protein